jgi:hypothetical protein
MAAVTPDHLIQSVLDIAELGWGAHHRMQTRKAGIWIVEGNLATYVKGMLQGTLKQLVDGFLVVPDMKKWEYKPCFSPKLEADFQAAYGKSFSDALLGGQLMPHDRACTLGGFNAKSMASKVTTNKSTHIRCGSGFVIPEIGEGYKCSWVNFFKSGKKVELYVVVGIPKHVQALANDLKELVTSLKEVLVLCGKGQKGPAETILAAATKKFNLKHDEEEVRDRLHFIYDCQLGKYPAEKDEDGFLPIVVSTQPLSVGKPGSWSILDGVYDLSVSEAQLTKHQTAASHTSKWDKTAGGAAGSYARPHAVELGAKTADRRKSVQDVNDVNQFTHAYTPELVSEKQTNSRSNVKAVFGDERVHQNKPNGPGFERVTEWNKGLGGLNGTKLAKTKHDADSHIIKAAAGESELRQQVRRASLTTAEPEENRRNPNVQAEAPSPAVRGTATPAVVHVDLGAAAEAQAAAAAKAAADAQVAADAEAAAVAEKAAAEAAAAAAAAAAVAAAGDAPVGLPVGAVAIPNATPPASAEEPAAAAEPAE